MKKNTEYKRQWRKKRWATMSQKQRDAERLVATIRMAIRQRKLKAQVFLLLGDRCSNPNCGWKNEDGTFGCTNPLILQIDHVFGGGKKEHRTISHNAIYRKVLADTSGNYQLLCANCNWLKRYEKKETPYRNVSAA